MKPGAERFEFYLQKLEPLLQQAALENNPAQYLFNNDARTPLFMLEGLSRLYGNLHNKKKFEKLKERFKQLEDGLGAVDYYDGYAKIFMAHPLVPVHLREFMQLCAAQKLQDLNEILYEQGWIGAAAPRLKKIKKQLKEADWQKPAKELKAIEQFYQQEIAEILQNVSAYTDGFTELEGQVHELRRDLRWLSIYPHALQGCIQLAHDDRSNEVTEAYRTPAVLQSRYNVLPDAGNNKRFLLLEKNYFYALSWLIAELGTVKDDGLQHYAITEALCAVAGMEPRQALNKSFEILGKDPGHLEQLLQYAGTIVQTYLSGQCLQNLVMGTAKIKPEAA